MKILIFHPDEHLCANLKLGFKRHHPDAIFRIGMDAKSIKQVIKYCRCDLILIDFDLGRSSKEDLSKTLRQIEKRIRGPKIKILISNPKGVHAEDLWPNDGVWLVDDMFYISALQSPMVLRQIDKEFNITEECIF